MIFYRKFIIFMVCSIFLNLLIPAETIRKKSVIKKIIPDYAVTRHQVKINNKIIKYTATIGKLPIKNKKGQTDAFMFYISYIKDGVKDKSRRPVMFSFNGGPGSSSIWMHMAFLGPRKVLYDDEGMPLPPPYKFVHNRYSILDQTDLVFIDPIATGYSRMVPGSKDLHKYHGIMEDIKSIGQFIRLYITRHHRWGSPKFIIGESYGTTRAAGLTEYLQSNHRIYINGTILVSTMMLGVKAGDDLSYMLSLPYFAATAWYHKKLPPKYQTMKLANFLKIAENYAINKYSIALIKGRNLLKKEKEETAQELAEFTGLKKQYILLKDLRIPRFNFWRELLKDQGLIVGRLDSRYTSVTNPDPRGFFWSDPAMNAWNGPFTGALNQYITEILQYKTDREYAVFGDVRPWKGWNKVNVSTMLKRAMIQNPHLQLLILEGYYDGACDYFSAKYTFDHLDLNNHFKNRIKFAFYESGHMMYIRKSDLAKSKEDLTAFINSALKN